MALVQRWTGAEAKALRQAMRLSVRDFAEHVDVDRRTVNKWEARGSSITLLPDSQGLLDSALQLADEEVKARFAQAVQGNHVPTRSALPALAVPGDADVDEQPGSNELPLSLSVGDITDRRQALKLLGTSVFSAGAVGAGLDPFMQSAVEAMEFTRRAEASQLGPQTLEHLGSVVTGMAAAFAHTSPHELFPKARWYRHHVEELLAGQHTLREGRELYRYAGWLSIVLAWTAHDLGDPMTAEAHCLDAWEHGWQAEDNEICAWAMDARATIALYSNQAGVARAAAERGRQQAPSGSAAAVRVSAQLARAYARLGQAEPFQEVLDHTRRSLDQLERQSSRLFSADWGRLASYAASSYIWLDRPDRAVSYAHEAISFYSSVSPAERSPTREAIARLDLALAHTELGQPDGAIEQIEHALSSERITRSVLSRLGDLAGRLQQQYPQLGMTKDVVERYCGMTTKLNRPQPPNP
jgi:transcriptional regulator with XRE-family HTH domain/tetratricopeptide (TPR) repeat protein